VKSGGTEEEIFSVLYTAHVMLQLPW